MDKADLMKNPKGFETGVRGHDQGVSILFPCVGRRVSLLQAWRRAARACRVPIRIVGTDITSLSPALRCCDRAYLVESTTHADYIDQLLWIARRERIRLVVPTVDLDLLILAQARERFDALGARVLISCPDVIRICQDKRKTCRFLKRHGFNTPETLGVRAVLSRRGTVGFPCIVKPWDGHASKGMIRVDNRRELAFYAGRTRHAICQPWIQGDEYTSDVYVDFDGQVRCVVPRLRLEVRNGEVSKGRVVKDPRIMAAVGRLVSVLKAGPGVITVQCIRSRDDRLHFIEINPRFGGGAPLTIKAGADLPGWILRELTGKSLRIDPSGFTDGLTMLRYDAEIWTH